MKWLLRKITNGLTFVSQYLLAYGAFGLFGIALLDSALIPLPGGPDAVLILLSTARPAWVPLYVFAATLGSVIGCLIFYYISRRAGRGALKRFSPRKQERVKELIDRYDVLSVLVASVLPPPFPFKLFIATAGVFRFSVMRFAVAVAAGRAFRYALIGYLAAHYGEHAKELLARYYPYVGLGVAALVIGVFAGRNLWRKQRRGGEGDRERAAGVVPGESESELL
ncbi:MAG TPA: VTT domain-containing protein [Pyrinomonadaceae bacterium]|nr:VTT domain-containing protein [Pyrinomonadaceae bacterium]